jgi:pimeloyl-ACP methyl ester carboxylesterase
LTADLLAGDGRDRERSATMAAAHPDDLTGALADTALLLFGQPAENTCADLAVYEGLPLDVLFPAPRSVPEARVTTRWWLPGVVSEDIVFTSLHDPVSPAFRRRYESEYRETHTVYARRIRTVGSRGRPRLLYLHGYMQPETVLEELGLLTSMAFWLDVEVVQLQPPFHGRRSPHGTSFSGELYWTADLVRSIEALRQNLLDARTLLSWLLAEDARPVGLMGLSLGGALTLALTCLDERFAFSIPMIAHMDLAAMVADAPVLAPMRRDLKRFGWSIEDFRTFVARIGWYDLEPRLARDRIHLFAAADDRFFEPALVEAMWRRWGEPEIHWYPSSHMGFLVHLPEALGDVRKIVDRHAP